MRPNRAAMKQNRARSGNGQVFEEQGLFFDA
jgi:hypothetical protein